MVAGRLEHSDVRSLFNVVGEEQQAVVGRKKTEILRHLPSEDVLGGLTLAKSVRHRDHCVAKRVEILHRARRYSEGLVHSRRDALVREARGIVCKRVAREDGAAPVGVWQPERVGGRSLAAEVALANTRAPLQSAEPA